MRKYSKLLIIALLAFCLSGCFKKDYYENQNITSSSSEAQQEKEESEKGYLP